VRTYRHIAADLNGIIGLQYGWHLFLFKGLLDPAYRCITCCAVLNAYLGQLAHRQAHMLPEKRDPVVDIVQRLGLMVSPDTHRRHHKTYDQGFPILSGTCLLALPPSLPPSFPPLLDPVVDIVQSLGLMVSPNTHVDIMRRMTRAFPF